MSRWEVCQLLLDRSGSRSQSNAVFGLIAFLNCSTIAVAYKGHAYQKFTIFLRFHPIMCMENGHVILRKYHDLYQQTVTYFYDFEHCDRSTFSAVTSLITLF